MYTARGGCGVAKIVAVPDMHAPWCDWKQIDKVFDYVRSIQPDYVVQLGDFYDFYSFSRYSRASSFITPKQELLDGRTCFETFWAGIQEAASNAKCYQLMGNHSVRIKKQVAAKFPELDVVLEYLDIDQLWRYPNVETLTDPRQPLVIDGIHLVHGDFLNTATPGARVKYLGENVVFGHTHKAHVFYLPHYGKPLWELACGHLSLSDALPLSYAPIKAPSTVSGFGIITDGVPTFIPL